MNGFIIIPAKDEEVSLPLVISDLLKEGICPEQILVVDNNSKDRTNEVAKKTGVHCLFEGEKGYGIACQKAISYIQTQKFSPSWIVFMDADRSDYAGDIHKLLQPILEEGYDLVTGERVVSKEEKKALGLVQRFGNKLVCSLVSIFLGFHWKDMGPFRAISYKSLISLNLQDRNWGWNIEMNVRALQKKLKIKEIPVRYRNRYAGESKISGNWKAIVPVGFKILYTFFKLLLFKPKNEK